MLHSLIDQPHFVISVDKFVQDIPSHQIHFEDITSFLNGWYNPFILSLDLDSSYTESIHAFVGNTQRVMGDQSHCDVIQNYEKTMNLKSSLFAYENCIIFRNIIKV